MNTDKIIAGNTKMDNAMTVMQSVLAMVKARRTYQPNDEEQRCSERILELASKLDELGIPYKKRNLFGCIDQLKFEWGGRSRHCLPYRKLWARTRLV